MHIMQINNQEIERKLRNSFLKIKKDMERLNFEVNECKKLILQQNNTISEIKNEITGKKEEKIEKKPKIDEFPENDSSKNRAMHSFIHYSFTMHSLNKHMQNMKSLKKDLAKTVASLPRQELFVFLTLYQLEEDLHRPITYFDLASKLFISEGCVRTYVSSLIKKGLPVLKSKANNRVIILSIHPEFRQLNLKNDLISLYYNTDITQTRLSDIQ